MFCRNVEQQRRGSAVMLWQTKSFPGLNASTVQLSQSLYKPEHPLRGQFSFQVTLFQADKSKTGMQRNDETHVGVTRSVTLPLSETVLASSRWAERHRRIEWVGNWEIRGHLQHITSSTCSENIRKGLVNAGHETGQKKASARRQSAFVRLHLLLCWVCVPMIHSWNPSCSKSS